MPKGFFTQGVCLLLERPVPVEEFETCLAKFEIVNRIDAAKSPEISGPGLSIKYRPEAKGLVVVDLQNGPWPDHMGHPQEEPMLFASWTMGHYGPHTFPGNLERAVQQAWSWKEAAAVVPQHHAFLRIKTTYVAGAGPDASILPPDYEPQPELEFVIQVALALAQHPAVLAYFNPGGEVVLPRAKLLEELAFFRQQNLPALSTWSNVRMFNPGNGWMVMDTTGMDQVDTPDHEACFPKGRYQPNDVANMLRNISLYRMSKGDVLKAGNTMDGAGGVRWRVFPVKEPLVPRPREVLRWFPEDGSIPPDGMQPEIPPEEANNPGFLSRMKRWLGKG